MYLTKSYRNKKGERKYWHWAGSLKKTATDYKMKLIIDIKINEQYE